MKEFTDTERLDWLEKKPAVVKSFQSGFCVKWWSGGFELAQEIDFPTFREAIDSEIRREEESRG